MSLRVTRNIELFLIVYLTVRHEIRVRVVVWNISFQNISPLKTTRSKCIMCSIDCATDFVIFAYSCTVTQILYEIPKKRKFVLVNSISDALFIFLKLRNLKHTVRIWNVIMFDSFFKHDIHWYLCFSSFCRSAYLCFARTLTAVNCRVLSNFLSSKYEYNKNTFDKKKFTKRCVYSQRGA